MLVNWRPTASIHLTQFSSRIKIASLITRPNKYTRNKSGCLQAAQLHTEGWNSTINGLRWNAYLWPASALTARIANAYLTRTQSRARSSRGESHLSRRMFASVYCIRLLFSFFFFNLYSFLFLSSPLFLLLLDALISICEIIHPVWMNYASTAQVDRTAMERFPRQYLRADFQPISKWFFFSFFLSLINGSWK